jgi:hypothetical protein
MRDRCCLLLQESFGNNFSFGANSKTRRRLEIFKGQLAGFKDDDDVRIYFRLRNIGEVEKDEIKEALSKEEWIWMIILNYRVNVQVHDRLVENKDGSLRLVLEHDFYEKEPR